MKEIADQFIRMFGTSPAVYKVPGRVNLIGEHTDYNGGFVMPGATDLSLNFAVAKSTSGTFLLCSGALGEKDSFDRYGVGGQKNWSEFFSNVIKLLNQEGHHMGSVNCYFDGNLPIGAGMSSSSALTCGFIFALNDLYDLGLSLMDITMLAGRAEHQTGLLGGMMDQFTILHGVENQLLLIDCEDMSYETIDFANDECEIILMQSMVSHDLINSEYNTRRQECESGLDIIRSHHPHVVKFRDIRPEHLDKVLSPRLKDRLSYVLEENERVLLAKDFIFKEEWAKLGLLLFEGHEGLKNKYKVTCEQTDFIVQWARREELILGARQMGGGFGGSVIMLGRTGENEFYGPLSDAYNKQYGLQPSFHKVTLNRGIYKVP